MRETSAHACLMNALAVSEFLATFGVLCEASKLSLRELQQAAASLSSKSALAQLYSSLLRCVLLEKVRSADELSVLHYCRAAQHLAAVTLPILWKLHRFNALLFLHLACDGCLESDSEFSFCVKSDVRLMSSEQVGQEGYMRSRARRWARVVDDAPWPEVLRRYLLATRAMLPQPSEAELARDVSCIDDDEAAVMAASLLAQQSFLR